MDEAELFHYWNKRLKEEGLGVYKGGREILLPDLIEKYSAPFKEKRKNISLPLEVLSPRQREAIYLLFYDGLSEAEAAETLGISRSSPAPTAIEPWRNLKQSWKRIGGERIMR